MIGLRQTWLVARRELRERIRSKGIWAGTALMLVVVVASIVVPELATDDEVTYDVGFVGTVPGGLPDTVSEQGRAVEVEVRVRHVDDAAVGEQAVRDGDLDVLVVDARLLQWRSRADEQLRAVVSGAIQLVAVQERAAAAGISAEQLAALAAPVPVDNEELGIAAGRSPADETAAYVMSVLLLVAMASYGQLVLTGVVQEKSSRVVEVLLARMPARTLLAGKVAGIGLLGFAQFTLTALAALVAALVVDTADLSAVSGGVMAWLVVWFVLGYAIYATSYGAFGALASRTEDASSVATPVTVLLLVAYWLSVIAVAGEPEGTSARLVSLFPASAPFALPGRLALGVTEWWEAPLAAALALGAIAGLVVLSGRIYSGAILRTGARVGLGTAWRAPRGRAVDPAPDGLRVASRRGTHTTN